MKKINKMRTKDVPVTGTAGPHSSVVRFSDSSSKSPTISPRRKDRPALQKRSIFVSEPRSHKEVASDVIWADCMNHGYKLGKSIGEGAYAKVKLAEVLPAKLARNQTLADIAEETGVLQVAIKVIDNKQVPKEFLKKFLPRELSNHVPLEPNKNVARVFEQFRTKDRVYVVMEYCCKGDLLDLINQQISENHRGVGEDKARSMFIQMCEGVQHIHNNGIVHRDLKCENILIDEGYIVKLTDFGFSTKFNDKGALLRTSCGSYAYTAPEVIKSTPYDGFKSDTWSLGIILFAMLNGRLPFNDSQLMEMEEDMKMQRLRFERTVSFESMVLVRRILQHNPAQRPTLQEILNDTWLTGKKMIPRQTNKPKWINPYEAKMEEPSLTDATLVVGSNPVYYKSTVPERVQDSAVTVKHEGNETVVLKSRAGPRKDIWTSGPTVVCQNRPSTWPKSEKESEQTTKRNQNRASRGPRSYGRNKSANTTVIVKSPPKTNRKDSDPDNEHKARVSSKTMYLSKWFMDKYMKKTTDTKSNYKSEDSNCDHCVEEEKMSASTTKPEKGGAALGKLVKQGKASQAEGGFVNLEDGQKLQDDSINDIESEHTLKIDIKVKTKSGGTRNQDSRIRAHSCFGKSADICNRVCSPEITRKVLTKSAGTRGGNYRKSASGSDPTASKSLDLSKTCLLNYMVNRSTSPAERVKYFRQRLMKLHGRDTGSLDDNRDGLPPLMVQALRPPPGCAKKEVPVKTGAVKSASSVNRPWRPAGSKDNSENWRTKPIQRTVVHSALP